MRWGRFSRFDLDDPDNVYLYLERRGPLFWILVLGIVFGGLLWFIDWAMHPNWAPPYVRGKGAFPIALIYLMPLPVRAIFFVCVLAAAAEGFFRLYHRMYDGRSVFVIGPSGVAWLDPWNPCALGWDEVREIRRETAERTLFKKKAPTLEFAFLSRPARPPRYVPEWLWEMVPPRLTGRRVEINPGALGRNEEQMVWLIRRFAGPVAIVDHEYNTLD